MRIMTVLALAAGLVAGPLAAKPHLREVPQIEDGVLAVGIADLIRKNCPEISGRLVKAYLYLSSLEAAARKMGYSKQEIESYVTSDAEKDRVRARGLAYMTANGVVEGDAQSYCALGRAEIEKSSQIGALLKAN